MPIALHLHPDSRCEIDPVLLERGQGVINADAGAIVTIGRPKHIGQPCHLVVSAAAACTVEIAPRCFFHSLALRLAGGGAIRIAAESTFNGAELVAFDGPSITIGRDCMFSSDIRVTTTDHHTIRDAATGERINPPKDVTIGDHVWIGRGVQVLKGARIGDGAMIGASALVSREIEPGCLAVGVPARPVRRGILWER